VVKDTIARNNIVILIDVSGSMEQKKFIDSVKIATYEFVNSLNPADLISIIAFESDTQILVHNLPARDTAAIRAAFAHMHTGGATNIGLAIQAAYSQVRKSLLNPGNNKIILITDGHIHIEKEEREKMLTAASTEGIEFSIIFFGKKVPDDMVKLAEDLNGTTMAGPPSLAADAMMKNVPADAIATPYGKCKPVKALGWHILTKIFFPVVLIGMCFYKLGTLAS
jgi:Ca-activated chloride channel family protein